MKPDNLTDRDVACRKCGKRARSGFKVTTEPCWAGDTTESDHDWVPYGGLIEDEA